MPASEQLRSFATNFDGETRADLVPFALKIRDAITEYYSLERLKGVFTPHDHELMNAFRSGMPAADQADANVVDGMYRDLCQRVDELDAKSLAAEVKEMDKVIFERWDARARAFVESLTPEAASAVLSEADRLGRTIKGVDNDLVGLARENPDFVKERIKQLCAARRFAPGSAR